MNLGDLIRLARQRKSWTQDDLAQRLGVERSYISQWETGARKWPQEYVRAIADTLGLSQVDMAVAAGLIDAPADRPAPVIADHRLQTVVERWSRLIPHAQNIIFEFATMAELSGDDEPVVAAAVARAIRAARDAAGVVWRLDSAGMRAALARVGARLVIGEGGPVLSYGEPFAGLVGVARGQA